ncbi:MAG TPA: GGDEF domain-containing protein [Polyangiaceae bacterium]|nr:GGDEF domain-containing protein [Polyangiaceae bacterium]
MAPRDSERTSITRVTEAPVGLRPSRPGPACIVVIYGPELGKRMHLGSAPFEIGRSSKNDLFLDHESISRQHARITFDGTDYFIADLNSTNGTFVNDVSIREVRLRDGDQVRIGRSILKFMTGENVEVHYHEEIYRLMTVDALTQAYNRRYFNEALEREFNRSRRYARALSLIAFDIDHFKRVNDTYGHLTGDNLLRHIAAAVKPRLRRDDVFARTGGEEFGVLLPEISLDGARTTAEKIRKIIEATPLKHEDGHIGCTVSLGVATLGAADSSGEELYRRADERLYEAKQGGRNRVA